MMGLETPIITIVIGEGGSGGALGLSVANRVYMLENAVFSVISPEGCASILWEDASKAADAAECLKITAEDMKRFGVAEDVIEENFDSFDVMCEDMKARLLSDVQELEQYSGRVLSENAMNVSVNWAFTAKNNICMLCPCGISHRDFFW